jgi:hypothetical protein
MRVLAACNVPDATHRTQHATQSTRRTRSTRSTAYSDRSVQQYNGRCNANRAHRQFAESGTPASSAHSGAIVRFRPPSVCLSVVHSTAALTGRIGSGRIGSGAAPVRSRCSCSASACACSACVSECIHGRRCLGGDRLRAVNGHSGRTHEAREADGASQNVRHSSGQRCHATPASASGCSSQHTSAVRALPTRNSRGGSTVRTCAKEKCHGDAINRSAGAEQPYNK